MACGPAIPPGGERLLNDLFASITHQGTRYPATAPTVRFLAELARRRGPGRLGDLA